MLFARPPISTKTKSAIQLFRKRPTNLEQISMFEILDSIAPLLPEYYLKTQLEILARIHLKCL